jgi:hypothetical protein
MADNKPPTVILGKCLFLAWAWVDVDIGTGAGLETIADDEGRCDRRAQISSSDSWPSCAESVARSADAIIIVDDQTKKG